MNINIIAVGKVKEKYIRAGIDEFTKRLSKYTKINIIELADEKTQENLSPKEENLIKEREGDRILAKIKDNSYIICLDLRGKKFSSQQMADQLKDLMVAGKSSFSFIIGGSLGLHQKVLSRADLNLSFSDMTFPHQLMRLILTEQIYRWFRIINGEPYHK